MFCSEIWTSGAYKATPHRVKNTSGVSRVSLPFFFDPAFDAEVRPLDSDAMKDAVIELKLHSSEAARAGARLAPGSVTTQAGAASSINAEDHAVAAAQGIRYGDYITSKVSRVFPELFASSSTAKL